MSGVCSFIASIIGLYSFAIIIRIVLSWFRLYGSRNGYGYSYQQSGNEWMNKVSDTLGKITDPYLRLFSNVKSLKRSNLDFTPVLALIVLNVFKSLFSMMAQTGQISLGVVLALIVDSLWGSLFSFIFLIIIVMLVIRIIAGRRNTYRSQSLISAMDPFINGPVGFVYRLFFRKSRNSDENRIVIVSLVFYLVCYIMLGSLCDFLVEILLKL